MHKNAVTLSSIWRDANTVYYEFVCGEALEFLLWNNRVLTLSCSEGVRSESPLLAAGFLYAFAPVGWCFGADIECDIPVCAASLRSLRKVGRILRTFYKWPNYDPFQKVRTTSSISYPRSQSGLMFSGGIDSSSALLEVENHVDWLIHMSNFDNIDDVISDAQYQSALASTSQTAYRRGLGWMHLRTNLAEVFKHNRFDTAFPGETTFWLGLQHVHHIGTAATVIRPLLKRIYLSGGLSELLSLSESCAGNSKFVNSYTFPRLRLVQEFDLRQHKVERLLDAGGELLKSIRVCYSSGNGTCDACRKCQATGLMVVAAGGSLTDTSFPASIASKLIRKVRELSNLPEAGNRLYNEALKGRVLKGSRQQRWRQLSKLLRKQAEQLTSVREARRVIKRGR